MLSLNSKESFPGSFDRCFVARTCYYHMACFNNVFFKTNCNGLLSNQDIQTPLQNIFPFKSFLLFEEDFRR